VAPVATPTAEARVKEIRKVLRTAFKTADDAQNKPDVNKSTAYRRATTIRANALKDVARIVGGVKV